MSSFALEVDDDGTLRMIETVDGSYEMSHNLGPIAEALDRRRSLELIVEHDLVLEFYSLLDQWKDRFDPKAEAEWSYRMAKGWA